MNEEAAHVYTTIPDYTMEGLREYVEERIPTGDFLRAVLENNLIGAMGQADVRNRAALSAICMYVYNELPAGCWGSPERVKAWVARENEHEATEAT